MFSPEVVETNQITTANAHRHTISLRRFRARDLVLLRFSGSVVLPIGWRWHGKTAWRIMGPKETYVTVRTVDRVPLTIDIAVIKRRTFNEKRPFRPYRQNNRIRKTAINWEFQDTSTDSLTLRAPDDGAQLLVKLVDYVYPDPDMDRMGSFKRGYVSIPVGYAHKRARMERKKQWMAEGNSAESWHGRTGILRVPAIIARLILTFSHEQTEDDTGETLPLNEDGTAPVYRLRRWHINLDNMPVAVLNALDTHGEATVGYSEIRPYLRRVRDLAQYRDAD